MRGPAVLLLILAIALQYPLWLGKGGWLNSWKIADELRQQQNKNQQLISRNRALAAEVRDLKAGNEAVEERARFELGLIRPGEVFVQIPKAPEADKNPDQSE